MMTIITLLAMIFIVVATTAISWAIQVWMNLDLGSLLSDKIEIIINKVDKEES